MFVTVFGTSTSLGLGALHVAAALHVLGVPTARHTTLIVLGGVMVAFVAAALAGARKGVEWLSGVTAAVLGTVMLFVLVTGPTSRAVDAVITGTGGYLDDFVRLSTGTASFSDPEWMGKWTLFYWAWALAWAPFIGMFIARISRGRTIREFIAGSLLIPSGGCVVWFTVMGGSAIHVQKAGEKDIAGALEEGPQHALFAFLDGLPVPAATTAVCLALMAVYMVTITDSTALTLGGLAEQGALSPPRWIILMWGLLTIGLTMVSMTADGIGIFRQSIVLAALPFTAVMAVMAWSLLKELRAEPTAKRTG